MSNYSGKIWTYIALHISLYFSSILERNKIGKIYHELFIRFMKKNYMDFNL